MREKPIWKWVSRKERREYPVGVIAGGHTLLWQLCTLSAPLGIFAGLFLPAYYAVMPDVLPEEDLRAGNALNSSSIQLALLIGALLAGGLVSRLGSAVAFVIDALSFVASAATLLAMQGKRVAGTLTRSQSPILSGQASTETLASEPTITFWRLVRSWRLLQVGLLVTIGIGLTWGGIFDVALPILAYHRFAAGANGYGLMMAAYGGGTLLGGAAAGMSGHLSHLGKTMLVLIVVLGACYACIPLAGGLTGALFMLGGNGVTNGMLTVFFFTIVQKKTPPHLLGRVMALFLIASWGLYPFSVAVAGVVVTHLGPAILFPATCAILLLAALFGWFQPDMRELETE